MTDSTDAALLAAARTDAAAFRALYDRYAARVLRYHERRTRDPDAAHDLTAETFAQAWLSRTRFRDEAGGSAAPWLFAIARHVLLGSVRRRTLERRACERLGLEAGASAAVPDETWLEGLDEALDALPPGAARGDPPTRRGRPRLRPRRRRARHHAPGRPGARAPGARRAAPPTLRQQEHPMSDLTPRLAELGDQLERAARRDLRPVRRRRPRGIVLAAVVAAVALPGAAVAAISLIGPEDVARSIPAGTLWLAGTEPSCTVVTQDVEYACTLGRRAGRRDRRLEGHRDADGRRLQARQRRLPLAQLPRHRVALLHRPGRGRSADHRRRLPRRATHRSPAWGEAGGVLDSCPPMAAPDSTEEILEVNRRYHDVAAADYDAKWGVDFGAVGRAQVLGKVHKLLGSAPARSRARSRSAPAPATSRST